MDKEYRKKIENLKVEGENFADNAMKSVYSDQKAALDELHAMIGKIYIDHSKDGFLNLSTVQKATITANVKVKLKIMGLSLGQGESDKVTSILGEVFKTTYYQSAFIMESGMKGNLKFNILKKEFVDAAVNAKYKGEFFSDRIWANKADMIDKLQSSIAGAMKGEMTIDKIGREIRDRFEVTAYDSQRLVRTETARVQTQASEDIARATGVKQVMWSATLDNLTNPEDAELDGKVWGIDDDHPEPPLHPNCRCCLINVPYEGWSPSARKDNETEEIIAYKTYAEWSKDKGI
jgi:SPP1 gp7 family putative phage head morphogenesis protein